MSAGDRDGQTSRLDLPTGWYFDGTNASTNEPPWDRPPWPGWEQMIEELLDV